MKPIGIKHLWRKAWLFGLVLPGGLFAQEAAQPLYQSDLALFTVNNTWMLIAAFLVFIMHLGFASLEAGLTQAKNTTNILFKNTAIISIGLLTYAICGFTIMYPETWHLGKYFGMGDWGLNPGMVDAGGTKVLDLAYNDGYTYWTDFIFQAMFAATAATIVSGAVAERIKLFSFLVFTVIYVSFIYPTVGSWHWGQGWLYERGFHDFAGSTLVHSVGGWAALMGAVFLGPRYGKYLGKTIRPIMGHNLPLVAIGVFLLWLGWYGFNGGSVLSADAGAVSFVFVTTTLAAAAGVMGSMATSWTFQKQPDLTMVLNGALAGLVGITAGADSVSVLSSIIIGLIAGVLVVFSVILWDKLKVDDPVGAISVHLVCGIWGTLAVGIFSTNPEHNFMVQLIGVLAIGAFCLASSTLIFLLIKLTLGLRVSEIEEKRGLDLSEHGQESYSGFQIFTTQ